MTKMHRGKKAAASLMAGILLCQMFVFGVSKTSADAREVAKKMSFEVVGEGIVTVTDTAERTQEITSGSVIEVPKGMCVRVQAESPKETDIAVHVLDKDGNYELEDVSEVQGKCFWRDVTAMELEKKVVVTFGKEDKKIRAVRTGQTRGNYNKPEAGDVFTGNCVITAVDGGNGHTVHSVTIGGFTGILAGVTATGGCADHTAAAPYVGQEYTYRYTVTGVNKVTGEVIAYGLNSVSQIKQFNSLDEQEDTEEIDGLFIDLTLEENQYIEVESGIILPKSTFDMNNLAQYGIYKVGQDIEAGEYKVASISDSYESSYEEVDGALGALEVADEALGGNVFKTVDLYDGQKYVTLEDGQYVRVVDAALYKN